MGMRDLFKNWRVITLLIFVLFALVTIKPALWNDGVIVRVVTPNSSAADAGMAGPPPNIAPLAHEKIVSVNGVTISTLDDYYAATQGLVFNQSVQVVTNKQSYFLTTKNSGEGDVFDGDTVSLGIRVSAAPTSNIRKGLDLSGGSRVLLSPEEELTTEQLDTVLTSLKQRLNVYGLSDVIVRDATDLSGNTFISVEIAGVTEEEVRTVVTSQGKFEAKIANETVFVGGKQDITYVCRSSECSGLSPQNPCQRLDTGQYACGFFFSITLSQDAAQKQADVTSTIDVISQESGPYLIHPLDLYLDDVLVDSLQIAASLKGQATTQIAISGSGAGASFEEAQDTAIQEMKQLQTVLVTGSLPVKLEIVKIDTVSPLLGEQFAKNIIFVGIFALLAVAIVVGIRYRTFVVVGPMIATMVSEIILILGFASLVGWNLDLAAMAGIVIAIGTAVDHLIVITDETLRGEEFHDWKRKLKNAMFIIVGAYLTVVAGMLPLWFAGAGLLKGFAFTTIVGVSFGVLIARPAYAAMLKVLLKE